MVEKITRWKNMNEFIEVIQEAYAKFEKRRDEKYGDEWKTMTLKQLQFRLVDEFNELMAAKTIEEIHAESLDVINFGLMIAERTKNKAEKMTCSTH